MTKTRHAPPTPKSAFARIVRHLRDEIDATDTGAYRRLQSSQDPAARSLFSAMDGYYRWLYSHIGEARVVCLDSGLIGAAPSPEEVAELSVGVRPPFPITLFDFRDRRAFRRAVSGFRQCPGRVSNHPIANVVSLRSSGARSNPTLEVRTAPVPSRGHSPGMVLTHFNDGQSLPSLRRFETFSRQPELDDVDGAGDYLRWALIGCLTVMESVNVDLVQGAGPPRGHQAHGIPHYDVIVRQNAKRYASREEHVHVDWSHRWEVRGHFKHYGEETPVARANPTRLIDHPTRGRCVRVWCPPYVKGPEDKPLIPKRRVVA